MFKFDDHSLAMGNARDALIGCKQKERESVISFLQQFQSHVDAFEHHYECSIESNKGLYERVLIKSSEEEPKELTGEAKTYRSGRPRKML